MTSTTSKNVYSLDYNDITPQVVNIVTKAVNHYYRKQQFAVINMDKGLSEEDMVGQSLEQLHRKNCLADGNQMSEALIFRFVYQQFLNMQIYQDRHYASDIFEDEVYKQKCDYFSEKEQRYGDIGEDIAESDAEKAIEALPAKPVIEGTINIGRFSVNVSTRSIIKLVYSGYKLTEICKAYVGPKNAQNVKRTVTYLFDIGTKRLNTYFEKGI